jgi:hypothetical protein
MEESAIRATTWISLGMEAQQGNRQELHLTPKNWRVFPDDPKTDRGKCANNHLGHGSRRHRRMALGRRHKPFGPAMCGRPNGWKGSAMTLTNIIGLAALAIGCVLLFFGWRASEAPIDQLSEALTGRFTDNTMWYLVGGTVGVVVGAAMLYRGYGQR